MTTGQGKRFCTQCGAPLEPADKFCGSCGCPAKVPSAITGEPPVQSQPNQVKTAAQTPAIPVQFPGQSPVQTPVQTAADGETVAGAFLASRKKSLFSIESFHVVVTSKRIIFAAFTNEMVKQAAIEEGKTGFLSGMLAAATIGYTYYKKYLSMDPVAALKENLQNFAIPRSNIRKVKLEIGYRHRDPKTKRETWDESKLEIETTGEKYSFKVPHQLHDQTQAVLRQGSLI